jgi:hypothetical protein
MDFADPIQQYEAMSRVARTAERLGFTSIWLFDHFHTYHRPVLETTFECWTSTAALARDTTSIRVGQMTTCNGYRNPALLAKMASTVDVMSHGRLDFGIGAGWNQQEYEAYGYPFPSTAVRLEMLDEALQVIRAMWTESFASFEGKHYRISGAINAFEADVAGGEPDDLGSASAGEDERQQECTVAPTGNRVGDNREETANFISGQASSDGLDRPWSLESVARVAAHDPHPDQEPKVARQAGDPGTDRRRRRLPA